MYMYVMTGAFLDNRSNVINMYEEERTAFQKYNEKLQVSIYAKLEAEKT